jgi:tRNA A-37 threonylcarbamoyl transferase component Bud32
VHHDPPRTWASFDVPDSLDVFWVAQVDGEAPEGSHVVPTEFGDMGLWRHPNDPALPGLRTVVTPGALADVLRHIAPDVDVEVVEIVTLEPLQRATVRVGDVGRAVYVKVIPRWRLHHVAGAHRRAVASGLPSPPVLHVDGVHGVVILGEIPGRPLAEHLERGLAIPDADQVWNLVERVTRVIGSHGDFHDRQILVDEAGQITGVVDLDDAGGDPLDDLADLIAHVAARAVTHPEQRKRIAQFCDDLRAAFGRHVDVEDLEQRVARASSRLLRRHSAFSHDHSPTRELSSETGDR